METENPKERLPDFDWEEHLERRITFDDRYFVENGIPFSPPVWDVGERAKQMADMLLHELNLDFTTDDVDAYFDPSDSELDYGDAQDDEDLFGAVLETMEIVLDYAASQDIQNDLGRTPLTKAEKNALMERLGELRLVEGRIVEDEDCDV